MSVLTHTASTEDSSQGWGPSVLRAEAGAYQACPPLDHSVLKQPNSSGRSHPGILIPFPSGLSLWEEEAQSHSLTALSAWVLIPAFTKINWHYCCLNETQTVQPSLLHLLTSTTSEQCSCVCGFANSTGAHANTNLLHVKWDFKNPNSAGNCI